MNADDEEDGGGGVGRRGKGGGGGGKGMGEEGGGGGKGVNRRTAFQRGGGAAPCQEALCDAPRSVPVNTRSRQEFKVGRSPHSNSHEWPRRHTQQNVGCQKGVMGDKYLPSCYP